MTMADSEIKFLLERLTWWQRSSGIDPDADSDLKSTGETNAAIESLKLKLDNLNASYYWDAAAREYKRRANEELADEEE